MIKSEYLIIGSGPVGILAAKYLLEKDKTVVIIDNSLKENLVVEKGLNLKNIDSKSYVYDFQNTAHRNKRKILPISSKTSGGFTRVWGGTLNPVEETEIKKMKLGIEQYRRIYNWTLKSIPNSVFSDVYEKLQNNHNNFLNINPPILSINKSLNNIWSAENLLEELLDKYSESLEYIPGKDVLSVVQKDGVFQISEKNKETLFDVKKVFICSGVFSSSQIASRMLKIENFSISDSDLTIWPVFYFGKNLNLKNSSLKNLRGKAYTMLIVNLKHKNASLKCQLYSLNEESLNEIEKRLPILSKPVKFISNFLNMRLFLFFVYKDSDYSKKGLFKIIKDKVYLQKIIKPEFKVSVYKFFLEFYKSKFFLIPIKYRFKNFGSFHSGITKFYKENQNIEFDNTGQLPGFSNIHFLDSTILNFIPSGPFTISTIVNCLATIELIENE